MCEEIQTAPVVQNIKCKSEVVTCVRREEKAAGKKVTNVSS